ncbi:DNA alkylation repair protein [Prolixibacteraceae bacterium JC049]|nr:DNA alkylation repair protein [Prolixibacteraceae bacterium JC049]
MIATKLNEIKNFCETNSDPAIIKKYQKYFKEGYDGYGIDDKVFKCQLENWVEQWKEEMTIEDYLDLGDELMKNGRFEEKHIAIHFLKSNRANFSKDTFARVGNWFDYGINDWATTDVLCMLVLSGLLYDKVIESENLQAWVNSNSEWRRRAIPVALVELNKLTKKLKPVEAIELVEPLVLDRSEYVQKGIGTLLRGLWKKYPSEIEAFLMKWKDQCGRLIVQYATEKMDKEYKKRFRKSK